MQHSSGKNPFASKLIERFTIFPYYVTLGFIAWCALLYMIFFVHPDKIQNLFFPNQYLLFLLIWFIAQVCTWTVITASIRRGVIIGFFWMLLLSWKINSMLNGFALLLTVVPLLFVEVFLTIMHKK